MKNTKRDETFLRETRHVIERHIELYPKCEPDDIVKLLYQSEFGCGHFVRSKEIAEEYLKREYEACMLTTKAAAPAMEARLRIKGPPFFLRFSERCCFSFSLT